MANILVVEDDVTLREVIHEFLEELGHTVHAFGDGAEAINASRNLPLDLVLSDIGLPGCDGWTVAKMVRKYHPTIPIYLMTGWTNLLKEKFAHISAINGIFKKPLSIEDLTSICGSLYYSEYTPAI